MSARADDPVYWWMLVAGGFLTVGGLPTFCVSGARNCHAPRKSHGCATPPNGWRGAMDSRFSTSSCGGSRSGWSCGSIIDKPDPGRVETPDESVGIADCQRVSQDLSALLDVEDEFGQDDLGETYTLEVSSPGLDRPLRHEADYRRFAGRLAKIVTSGADRTAERICGTDHRASTRAPWFSKKDERRTGCRSTGSSGRTWTWNFSWRPTAGRWKPEAGNW